PLAAVSRAPAAMTRPMATDRAIPTSAKRMIRITGKRRFAGDVMGISYGRARSGFARNAVPESTTQIQHAIVPLDNRPVMPFHDGANVARQIKLPRFGVTPANI